MPYPTTIGPCHGSMGPGLRRGDEWKGGEGFRASGLDRRHRELDHALATRPDNAFEAEPQCVHGSRPWTEGPRVAGQRDFDGFAGQRLDLPGEQKAGGAWSRQPWGRPAGLPNRPLVNRPRRSACSACFIRSRSGIANSYNDTPAPARGDDIRKNIACVYGNLMVVIPTDQDRRQRAAEANPTAGDALNEGRQIGS
jgi:hypothetical protein